LSLLWNWLVRAETEERKVRATQGIPLPNRKRSAKVCRCRRKQPPKELPPNGKASG